jgi:hypothetical protein
MKSKTTTIALGLLLAAAAAAAEGSLEGILRQAFADWTGDKAERLVLISAAGQAFVFNSGDKNQVRLSLGELLRTLSRQGVKLEEISDVIHSHNEKSASFSEDDLALFRILRSYGFRGAFRIYYPETRRILTLQSALRAGQPEPAPGPGQADPRASRK